MFLLIAGTLAFASSSRFNFDENEPVRNVPVETLIRAVRQNSRESILKSFILHKMIKNIEFGLFVSQNT